MPVCGSVDCVAVSRQIHDEFIFHEVKFQGGAHLCKTVHLCWLDTLSLTSNTLRTRCQYQFSGMTINSCNNIELKLVSGFMFWLACIFLLFPNIIYGTCHEIIQGFVMQRCSALSGVWVIQTRYLEHYECSLLLFIINSWYGKVQTHLPCCIWNAKGMNDIIAENPVKIFLIQCHSTIECINIYKKYNTISTEVYLSLSLRQQNSWHGSTH